MNHLSSIWRRFVLAMTMFYFSCSIAHADGLPWEGPLKQLQGSLTGPVAKAIGMIALAASGGMLAFGGELSDFTKRMLMLVLALAVMLMANSFMSSFGF
jgi:type IV secretion system protein VirB2